MPDAALISVVVIIALALAFDFVNGFHDAANSIATVVSTRVLTPLQGVAWASLSSISWPRSYSARRLPRRLAPD